MSTPTVRILGQAFEPIADKEILLYGINPFENGAPPFTPGDMNTAISTFKSGYTGFSDITLEDLLLHDDVLSEIADVSIIAGWPLSLVWILKIYVAMKKAGWKVGIIGRDALNP